MNLIKLFFVISILLIPLFAPAGSAAQSLVLNDDVQMHLGDAFLAESDYYRAITEYKRLTILFPDSERLPEALYQIGIAYYRGQDYAAAARSFAKVRKTYDSRYFSKAAFHEGLSYEKLGRQDEAALAFQRARFYDEAHPVAAEAQLALSLNALARDDAPAARQALEHFLANAPDDERLPGVQSGLDLLDSYESSPRKSPALAGVMSAVIPGSGQIYAERYRDGLMAFLVNGLLIAGTVAAIDDENYAVAAIVGGIGIPFYTGNIYGAANAARKWNLSLTRQFRDALALKLNYSY